MCANCLSSFPLKPTSSRHLSVNLLTPSSPPRPHAHAQPRNVSNTFRFLARPLHGSARHKTDTVSAHQLRAPKSQDGPFGVAARILCVSVRGGSDHVPHSDRKRPNSFNLGGRRLPSHTHTHTHTVNRTGATSCRVRGRAASCSREQDTPQVLVISTLTWAPTCLCVPLGGPETPCSVASSVFTRENVEPPLLKSFQLCAALTELGQQ